MYRQPIRLQGVRVSVTTGATLSLSMHISAPTGVGERIHIARINRSHHLWQTTDSVITLYAGTTPIWRCRSQFPMKAVYDFMHPIALPPNTEAKITMTSSLNTHTLTILMHYFIEE